MSSSRNHHDEQVTSATPGRRRPGRAVSMALVMVLLALGAVGIATSPASAYVRYAATVSNLALRSGPGTQYSVLQRVNAGTPLDIVCQVQGGTNVGGNATWDRLTGGQWVADYYTTTPSFNSYIPGVPDCGQSPPPATRESRAAAWAVREKNSPDPTWSDEFGRPWSGYCEGFVEVAYGTRGRFGSAIAHYNAQNAQGRIHRDTGAPAGALVFYGGGGGYGHVGISLGGGQVISTQGYNGQRLRVWQHGITSLSNPYYGWAYAFSNWPGR